MQSLFTRLVVLVAMLSSASGNLKGQGLLGRPSPFRYGIRGTLAFVDAPAEDVEVDLRSDTGDIIAWMYARWNGEFDFGQHPDGNYWLTIDSPHFNSVNYWIRLHDPAAASNLRVVLQPRVWKDTSVRSMDAEELVLVNIPGITPILPADAINDYWKGVDYVRSLDLKKAAQSFQDAIDIQPDFYEANLQLGLVRLRESNLVEATRLLEHAAQLNPGAARPRRALGEAYFKRLLYFKSIEVLAEARKLGPVSSDDAFYLGSSYYKLDRFGPAEEELLRAQSLGKYREGSYLQLYNLYMKTRRPEKALAQLEDYLKFFVADDTYRDVQKREKLLKAAIKKAQKAGGGAR
jgi:tetratricopeptide (TPR) repeat protein